MGSFSSASSSHPDRCPFFPNPVCYGGGQVSDELGPAKNHRERNMDAQVSVSHQPFLPAHSLKPPSFWLTASDTCRALCLWHCHPDHRSSGLASPPAVPCCQLHVCLSLPGCT